MSVIFTRPTMVAAHGEGLPEWQERSGPGRPYAGSHAEPGITVITGIVSRRRTGSGGCPAPARGAERAGPT